MGEVTWEPGVCMCICVEESVPEGLCYQTIAFVYVPASEQKATGETQDLGPAAG